MNACSLIQWVISLLLASILATARKQDGTDPLTLDSTALNATSKHQLYPNSPRFRNRGLDEEDWQDWVNKGCNLVGAMSALDPEAATFLGKQGTAESEFTDFPDDFEAWGYTENLDAVLQYFSKDGGPDINDALKGLGINMKKENQGGPNVAIGYKHTKPVKRDNQVYQPTQADFRAIINAKDGIIIGWYKFGPKHKGRQQKPPVTLLPKLKNWHDVAFLKWKYQTERRGKPINGLRYIMSSPIYNSDTLEIIAQAVGEDDDIRYGCREYSWARRPEFTMDSEEGRALLASPNGRGAALILIQHKSAFGQKTRISKASVFCSDSFGVEEVSLLFHVDYSQNEVPTNRVGGSMEARATHSEGYTRTKFV